MTTGERESLSRDGADPIVRASWAGTVVFAGVQLTAVSLDAVRAVAVGVDLVLFLAGCAAFLVALGRAAGRSRHETIDLPGLFFLSHSAPQGVRRHLLASTAVEVVVAFTAAALAPYTSVAFGILVPVYGLGLTGLWGATRGRYAPRG